MVRTGGLSYTCEPSATMGNRITEMKLRNGRTIDENRSYKVAGWATVAARSPGKPVWEVVADYLRDRQTISLDRFETPDLKGVSTNPGIADYAGKLD
jgi:sulfur-oxidizing protein SoxB